MISVVEADNNFKRLGIYRAIAIFQCNLDPDRIRKMAIKAGAIGRDGTVALQFIGNELEKRNIWSADGAKTWYHIRKERRKRKKEKDAKNHENPQYRFSEDGLYSLLSCIL